VFADAGVPFALSVSSRSSFAQRYLWYQAARCVAHGVSRQTALEAGKQANLLILSGDPLDATTHVEQVLIRGRVVYERSKDFQLRKLLEGELEGATAAEDDEHPHPIEEDEGDPEAEDGDE
jgi:hypothetical protein